jgi:hypothetical protein
MHTSTPRVTTRGAECALGVALDAPVEDDPDLRGPAQADVVSHHGFEDGPAPAGLVEDDRAGDLDLAHRQLPPVAGLTVLVGERGRDRRHPAGEERLDVGGPQAITDRLQRSLVLACSEAVSQLGEPDPGPGGLALCPFMPVDLHLGRIREVGAQLDEAARSRRPRCRSRTW